MSFATKRVICRCCGQEFSAKVLKGFLSTGADLDSNPHQPEIYEKAVVCPHCGYVTSQLRAEVSDAMRTDVRSPEYRQILSDETLPDTARRLILDARMMQMRDDGRNAGYQYLTAFWCVRERGETSCDLLEKAVGCFSEYLETNADVDTAMVLIDCLRQLGRFIESQETAESLSAYVSDPDLHRVLQYERTLAARQDTRPHARSEVLS